MDSKDQINAPENVAPRIMKISAEPIEAPKRNRRENILFPEFDFGMAL